MQKKLKKPTMSKFYMFKTAARIPMRIFVAVFIISVLKKVKDIIYHMIKGFFR